MQPRYIAIIGRAASATEIALVAQRAGLQVVFHSSGLVVLANSKNYVIPIEEGIGVVIGTLFSRTTPPHRVRSIKGPALGLLRSRGANTLLSDYWGSYVAIRTEEDGSVRVLRDPSGGLPSYYRSAGDLTFVASDVDLLVQAFGWTPEIDWKFVTWHLWSSMVRTSQTALIGLSEIFNGFELEVDSGTRKVLQRWSPWDHVSADTRTSASDFAAQLRVTTKDCIQALAACYQHAALGVSGGLDSSIVASCIAGGRTPLTCFTMVTDDPDGDERRHARQLTDDLGLQLCTWFFNHVPPRLDLSVAIHLPRPVGRPHLQPLHHYVDALTQQQGVDALFTGNGGDNVFCLMRSATPVIDRFQAQGLSSGLLRTFMDVCRLTDSTIWDVAGHTFALAKLQQSSYEWRSEPTYLNISDEMKIEHAWLRRPTGAPYGKAVHIARILQIQHSAEGTRRSDRLPLVTPLLSQPIMELCLQIPTWHWIADGRDRSVARAAFANDLPARIINRQSKGGPGGYIFELNEAHRAWLRERLANGLLVRHGVVDREAVLAAIDQPAMSKGIGYIRLLELADAEAWVRHWSGYRSSEPAAFNERQRSYSA